MGTIYKLIGFLGGASDKEPAYQGRKGKTWVRSLGWEDPLEEGMVTHSSILAGESQGQRSLVGYSSWGCKESDMTEATKQARTHTRILSPLHYT